MNMTNINDFDPKLLLINEIKTCKSGSTLFEISYCAFLEKVESAVMLCFVKLKKKKNVG